ncbi:MAG: hypothetical protein BWX76_00696 [Candidatus Cloacimonetes bacterium ADurb.Bin089]|nr:MAG: hypothetical protein BWX76_00696 [Candidatus Cloacimonetes bacterium ADurb.Bin089]
MDNINANFLVGEFLKAICQGLCRAIRIRFQDNIQGIYLFFLNAGKDILQGTLILKFFSFQPYLLSFGTYATCSFFAIYLIEDIPGFGGIGKTVYSCHIGRIENFNFASAFVFHFPNSAMHCTANNNIAFTQSSFLN